jgi:hypothetical protein
MADKKISELTAKTTLAGTEEFIINDSGVSKKVTQANLVLPLLPKANGTFTGTFTGTSASSSKIRLLNPSDCALASTLHPFQIGEDSSVNLIIDNNEIMARNNGAAANLGLNADGGTVSFGGGTVSFGGAIAVAGTVDGRDIAVDGAKLDIATAKAWARVDQGGSTGHTPIIRNSYNISSFTDISVGNLSLAFTNTIASYASSVWSADLTQNDGNVATAAAYYGSPSTTEAKCRVFDTLGNISDSDNVHLQVFGD